MKKKILTVCLAFIFILCPVFAKDKIKVIDKDLGIYIFKINTKKYGEKIKPYLAPKLIFRVQALSS